jgi:ATP adenylyltransferase
MMHLYAPWRTAYVTGESRTEIQGCVFCHLSQTPKEDIAHHVIDRDAYCFSVMNRFPYSPGHFLIVPHVHTGELERLDTAIWQHMCAKAQKGVAVLKKYGAQGVNIGMNLESCGGAGIPEHLHLHLVPRFSPDTNFMTTVGQTRIYSSEFEEVYHTIKTLADALF